jgi:hypothetical protein
MITRRFWLWTFCVFWLKKKSSSTMSHKCICWCCFWSMLKYWPARALNVLRAQEQPSELTIAYCLYYSFLPCHFQGSRIIPCPSCSPMLQEEKPNVSTCSPGVLSFTPTDGRVLRAFHHAPPPPRPSTPQPAQVLASAPVKCFDSYKQITHTHLFCCRAVVWKHRSLCQHEESFSVCVSHLYYLFMSVSSALPAFCLFIFISSVACWV